MHKVHDPHRVDPSEHRSHRRQTLNEQGNGGRLAVDFDHNAINTVSDKTAKGEFRGEAVDVGPKPHPLHDAGDVD